MGTSIALALRIFSGITGSSIRIARLLRGNEMLRSARIASYRRNNTHRHHSCQKQVRYVGVLCSLPGV